MPDGRIAKAALIALSLGAAAFAADGLLRKGDIVSAELGGASVHVYRVVLKSGEFLLAITEQQGIDLEVTLKQPGGAALAHSDLPNRNHGPEPIAAVVSADGEYRLEVKAADPNARPGRY